MRIPTISFGKTKKAKYFCDVCAYDEFFIEQRNINEGEDILYIAICQDCGWEHDILNPKGDK